MFARCFVPWLIVAKSKSPGYFYFGNLNEQKLNKKFKKSLPWCSYNYPSAKNKTENKNSDQNYWASVSVEHSSYENESASLLLHDISWTSICHVTIYYWISPQQPPSGQRKVAVALLLIIIGGCYGEVEV